jgi:hypothetical protein
MRRYWLVTPICKALTVQVQVRALLIELLLVGAIACEVLKCTKPPKF